MFSILHSLWSLRSRDMWIIIARGRDRMAMFECFIFILQSSRQITFIHFKAAEIDWALHSLTFSTNVLLLFLVFSLHIRVLMILLMANKLRLQRESSWMWNFPTIRLIQLMNVVALLSTSFQLLTASVSFNYNLNCRWLQPHADRMKFK